MSVDADTKLQQWVIGQQKAGECVENETWGVRKSKESGGCLPLRGWDQVKVSERGVRRGKVGKKWGKVGGIQGANRPDDLKGETSLFLSTCRFECACVCVWWGVDECGRNNRYTGRNSRYGIRWEKQMTVTSNGNGHADEEGSASSQRFTEA